MDTSKRSEIEINFINSVMSFLSEVDKTNFGNSYSGLAEIIELYKTKISKEDVLCLIKQMYDMELTAYQEEVLQEIDSRIVGFSSPHLSIVWPES